MVTEAKHRIRCDEFTYQAFVHVKSPYADIDVSFIDNYGNTTKVSIHEPDEWGSIDIGGFERDYHFFLDEEGMSICMYGLVINQWDNRYMTTDDSDNSLCRIVYSDGSYNAIKEWIGRY